MLTPVFAGGMMLGCHALARASRLKSLTCSRDLQDGRLGPLAVLGLILLAMAIVLGIVVVAVAFVTIGVSGLGALVDASNPNAYRDARRRRRGPVLPCVDRPLGGMLIWMALWFAPALVVIDGMEPLAAMKASFDGVMANLMPFLIYGLIYIGLAIVASIPFRPRLVRAGTDGRR